MGQSGRFHLGYNFIQDNVEEMLARCQHRVRGRDEHRITVAVHYIQIFRISCVSLNTTSKTLNLFRSILRVTDLELHTVDKLYKEVEFVFLFKAI